VLIGCYSALGIGRLVGPLVMRWIAPLRLTMLFAAAAAICSVVSVVASGPAVIAAVLATCFFMSIVLPTIFADAIQDLGEMAKSATAVMMFVAFTGTGAFALLAIACTPAILPWIMLLPALCFAAVAAIAFALKRNEPAACEVLD
jgi:FHS family L-fucose permease-like MFS transporter